MPLELPVYFFEELKEAVETKAVERIRALLDDLYAQDISQILEELEVQEGVFIIQCLDTATAAEIISNMDDEDRTAFLLNFSGVQIANWVMEMDSDDAADMLNGLEVQLREEVLAALQDPQQADDLIELLHYEEDVAGGLMAKELIRANLNWKVLRCIEEIRQQAENVEKIYSVYVVDDENRLLGRVSLKKIILAADDTRVEDIYQEDLVSVYTYQPQKEVVELMRKYDLEAIPVVNPRGQLVGRITIDDIVDVITEQAELDRQMMAGVSEDVEETDTALTIARARLPWLLIGMAGGLAGARIIGLFEADLSVIPAMAFFIPLIGATGGNVGIQSSSIVLQSLASDNIKDMGVFARFLKSFWVAFINGLVISSVVFLFTFIFYANLKLALVVAIALFVVVQLASFMGTATPLVLSHFKINPALASGPFITTTNDIIGLTVYFLVAHWLYF
ncbi:magnesium transporter [Eisenibacter elegans]|uniref:magnesium transporter n=1 Tax=Eisenibacter elegans TaxID=997 RepID=UPI000427B8CC|nr:magnesium transporter [Eisenibacter elegans]